MKRSPEGGNLLDDVLGESAPADFRAELLADTLRLAGRRRRSRRMQRGVSLAAALALGAFLGWRALIPTADAIAGCEVVRTHPLAEGTMVRTQHFSGEVRTDPQSSMATIETPAERNGFRFV